MTEGVCKLTGQRGQFVRSHLIPVALAARPDRHGPLYQHGRAEPPVRRWSSWYDEQLVIGAGEKILADYDGYGIAELKRHKLTWRSWGPMLMLSAPKHRQLPPFLSPPGAGARRIVLEDPGRLRLFFLSLLWRAAETSRWEFNEIDLKKPQLDTLRKM